MSDESNSTEPSCDTGAKATFALLGEDPTVAAFCSALEAGLLSEDFVATLHNKIKDALAPHIRAAATAAEKEALQLAMDKALRRIPLLVEHMRAKTAMNGPRRD
jgi:hypothetical protein